jgi:hypothetical protein
MRGVIAITDWDWFQFLRDQPGVAEANFWRPTDLGRPRVPAGTPFIFNLRKKHGGGIVGFGIFAPRVIQSMWLAWDEFETKDGAATFAEFHPNAGGDPAVEGEGVQSLGEQRNRVQPARRAGEETGR